jgi:hypothetical protein
MRWIKPTLIVAAMLLGAVATGNALADGGFHGGHFHGGNFHGGARVGVFVGVPLFGPWYGWGPYYYPPYYYPPSPYYYPSAGGVGYSSPPVYVEQGQGQGSGQSQYWYYCNSPQGYYPYVKECPGGWQRVAPQPPPG